MTKKKIAKYDPGFDETYRTKLLERLQAKIRPGRDRESCAFWIGGRFTSGPGGIGVMRHGKYRTEIAARVIFELAHGRTPVGQVIRSCAGGELCCNPLHLEDHGTALAVAARCFEQQKGRWMHAKVTPAQVRAIRRRRTWTTATLKELGADYGVSQQTVDYLTRGVSWKRVDDE